MRQRQTAAAAVWLDVDLRTVEEHLALDEALLEQAHEGTIATTVVRTWMAGEPTVIVGSSSRLEDEVDAEACRRAGARILRRTSGGLAVVIGPGCLMWSVVQPHPAGPPPIERLHARMLDPLAGGLSTLVDAPGGVTRRGSSDLVVERDGGPRKVSGNALRVRQRGTLYHGTLLDAFDLELVTRLLRHPPREPDYRAGRPHAEFVANLGVGAPALVTAVRTAFAATGRLSTWPEERVARLVAERYARAEWTARR